MIMAQEQDLTFITENIPPATSFIQSGKSLRLSHVGRQEATLITEMLKRGDDPNKINEKDWEKRRESWKREAQIIYPDEGDYKVNIDELCEVHKNDNGKWKDILYFECVRNFEDLYVEVPYIISKN